MTPITATMYLRGGEVPTHTQLHDLVLRSFAGALKHDTVPMGLFMSLLQAYYAAAVQAKEAYEHDNPEEAIPPLEMITGEVAATYFSAMAARGYEEILPGAIATKEAVPTWPTWLPQDAFYTPRMVQEMGYLAGVESGWGIHKTYAHLKNVATA